MCAREAADGPGTRWALLAWPLPPTRAHMASTHRKSRKASAWSPQHKDLGHGAPPAHGRDRRMRGSRWHSGTAVRAEQCEGAARTMLSARAHVCRLAAHRVCGCALLQRACRRGRDPQPSCAEAQPAHRPRGPATSHKREIGSAEAGAACASAVFAAARVGKRSAGGREARARTAETRSRDLNRQGLPWAFAAGTEGTQNAGMWVKMCTQNA